MEALIKIVGSLILGFLKWLGYPSPIVLVTPFVWTIMALFFWGFTRIFTKDDALVFNLVSLAISALVILSILIDIQMPREIRSDNAEASLPKLLASLWWLTLIPLDLFVVTGMEERSTYPIQTIIAHGFLSGLIYGCCVLTTHLAKNRLFKKELSKHQQV